MHEHDAESRARLARLEGNHFWFAGRDVLIGQLLERFPPSGIILDLGCGTGRYAKSLLTQGRAVIAFDHDPPIDGPQGRVAVGDAEALGLCSASVGTILARDILEHVDDERALSECHRVLRANGHLIALVPGWPSLWSDRDVRAGHLRRYRRRELTRRLVAAGFVVVDFRGYQFALLPLLFVSRLLSRLRGPAVIDREEVPSRFVNHVLGAINKAEAKLAQFPLRLPPTGSSFVVVAVKP